MFDNVQRSANCVKWMQRGLKIMLKYDLMHGKVAGFPTTHWTCCVFGYEIKSPQLWEKTENFDIPGEMTTEITHDVMYVPLLPGDV